MRMYRVFSTLSWMLGMYSTTMTVLMVAGLHLAPAALGQVWPRALCSGVAALWLDRYAERIKELQ